VLGEVSSDTRGERSIECRVVAESGGPEGRKELLRQDQGSPWRESERVSKYFVNKEGREGGN
jgi:hypothetical protein